MDESVVKPFQCFLQEKSVENFLRLREAVAASKGYVPYGKRPTEFHGLLDRGEFSQAQAGLRVLGISYFLNPGFHRLLSFVLHKLGDDAGARIEHQMGAICLEGIMLTGTGSKDKPYLALHTEDEYDVLEHLSKISRGQSLFVEDGRAYDCHECEDGTQVWFDITIPYSFLNRKLAP